MGIVFLKHLLTSKIDFHELIIIIHIGFFSDRGTFAHLKTVHKYWYFLVQEVIFS